MFRYILAFIPFITYLLLLSSARKHQFSGLLKKSLVCFIFFAWVWLLVFVGNGITNLLFFGDFFSPLELELNWVPILRSPLIEESSKVIMIFALRKRQKVSGNELVRLGGIIGNWYFLLENVVYILQKNISLSVMFFRLFPGHITWAMLDAFGLKDNFSKKFVIFPVVAMFLHGIHNFLSINYFPLYVSFGFAVSLTLFFILLIKTPLHRQNQEEIYDQAGLRVLA